tara:strand:- start:2718 stop:3023 length:306 start_codon:yes stop_codon:yes gene_type:complete
MCSAPDIPDPPPAPDPLPAPPPAPPAPGIPTPLSAPVAAEPKNPKLRKNSKRGRLKQAGSGAEQLRIDLAKPATTTGTTGSTNTGTTGSGVNIPGKKKNKK